VTCRLKVYADLNPRYPQKGERRYALFLRDGCEIEMREGKTFTSRRSAERAACRLQVEASFRELGILVQDEEVRRG
jgi:hypothetical protein